MKLSEVYKILFYNSKIKWNKVNTQPCVHTFYNDFYINLCLYNLNGLQTISLDVDDVKNGNDDIVNENINETDEHFEKLLAVYNKAMQEATNIANAVCFA